MASRFSLLLLLPLLSLLSLSADARPGVHFHPCNTLVISTYSFSLRNPNPDLRRPGVVTFFAGFRPDADVLRHRHHRFFLPASRLIPYQRVEQLEHQQLPEKVELPFSLGFSSLKDRTKDILNVVASLLLGAACGALTAGTMYLICRWFVIVVNILRAQTIAENASAVAVGWCVSVHLSSLVGNSYTGLTLMPINEDL
ncbi:hypothetical protein Cgig2_005131 [Carnegiea gigantea]|uniref:Uncharacterized protein n=1 Tax=Carnegiea gigantea TaxID=171969 RepID=A0A9Q1KG29_9CARY|nr:hypothetical protein Cgig2_005131 [Carnegiea gigantea]